MTPANLRRLIELITEIAQDSSKPWADRRDDLLDEATEEETSAIHEFASWFEV